MKEIDEETKELTQDEKIVERFEKDWESMHKYWDTLHKRHRACTKFTWFNDQWSDDAKTDRAAKPSSNATPLPPRPMNVYNISKPFIIKVINGVKKMRPQLQVNPVDDSTDKILADVQRGILKAIEKNTGAVPNRMAALKDTVGSGFGFYRFDTDWENPKSMKQSIRYRIIEDATTVLWDEGSKEPSGSDLMKCIIQDSMTEAQFKKETGKKWDEVQDTYQNKMSEAWGRGDTPSLSEYWYIEEKEEILVSIDGQGEYLKDVEKRAEAEGIVIEDLLDKDEETGEYIQRKTTSRQIWRCKLAGKQVLKKVKWPGYWIPVFKIDGRKTVSDEKVRLDGLTMDVEAPQRSYNYARNNKLERMSLTQKSGIFHPIGGIPAGEKHKYDTANSRNWSRYGFNAYDKQQRPLPPPFRIQPVNLDPGAIQEEQTAAEEIKASLGMFGSYMGDTQGEKSGKAILAGAAESSDITFDFAYNLGLTMDHEGKVLSELIPKVHDTAQQVRMIGDDEKEKVIWVNKEYQDEKGKPQFYDLSRAKFDISVTMGKSSEDKRGETRLEMEALFGKVPELREISADIFVKAHEWDKADELGERYRRFIKQKYPGVIEDEDDKAPNPEVQQMQQQMQEMGQMMKQLQGENEQLKNDKMIESKKVENEEMNNEELNEIKTFEADTDRMKVENDSASQAEKNANEREKLRVERDKAAADYKLEILKLNEQRDARMSQPNPNEKESNEKYEAGMSELNEKLESKFAEITLKEQAVPVVNITNVIPGKQDAKIKGPGGKEYNVTYGENKE